MEKEYIDGILVYCGGFKDGVRDGRGRIYKNGLFKRFIFHRKYFKDNICKINNNRVISYFDYFQYGLSCGG